ncbi:MAG: [FeFe] hydrogenase H-cluster radical SAM maturase HydE [Hungatella sp.]|nr:[FeFe] hydrogenase H-cluster radical SAM maturase HydE [Hungatella sp.]
MEIGGRKQWKELLLTQDRELRQQLFASARQVREQWYGKAVLIRGLIEFTNYCKNDCYYCGIRRSNQNCVRYRLTEEEIISCCQKGYDLGFRTFVLQGGEDMFFTDIHLSRIVAKIKEAYPDCAVTLSVGEKNRKSYEMFFKAGADRYLLRHETANKTHYQKLHPREMSLENRKRCLWDLKEIGFQVGAGMMVGSPYQTVDYLLEDLEFLKELQPDMVGIGPFIPHHETDFAKESAGTVEQTLKLLAIVRLLLPKVLLPATTALGTLQSDGREQGILAGANVVMPNLSPENVRGNYLLYDNKLCTGIEAVEGLEKLKQSMEHIGYKVVVGRGDRV